MNIPRRYLTVPYDSIHAESAAIMWNDKDRKICDVLITPHPIPDGSAADTEYEMSGGACYTSWLFKNWQPDKDCMWTPSMFMSPEGTFGMMLRQGFTDEHELRNALIQFARISSCHWAQAALYAFSDKEEAQVRTEARERHAKLIARRLQSEVRPELQPSASAEQPKITLRHVRPLKEFTAEELRQLNPEGVAK